MKKLRYIFLLLIAALSGFAISSCEDDDVVAAEVTEEAAEGSGETVKTTFTVGISAPDVSADLDPVTRASADNANIEYAKPENGGRFQNIVVVLVGPPTGSSNKHKIYGVHCHNWNDGVGVKEYNVIFSDINIDKNNDLGKEFKVYAFGNIPELVYTSINTDITTANPIPKTYVEDWIPFYYSCVSSQLSVSDPYNLSFKPGVLSYTLKYTYNSRENSQNYISTGMPVNNSATAIAVKGNTQFNVALKRVCARLQVTFRNFTGTYKDYDNGGAETPNNVYVDKFVLKGILAKSTNYFYNSSNTLTTSTQDFDILKALGGATATNDHIINKIENGKDLVISMYVFENNKGGYQYNLKVDRGKSLGLNTTVIDTANAYVIWNNDSDVTNPSSISYRDGVIKVSRKQDSYDKIPFSDQVFWQFVEPSTTHKTNVFALKHYQIDLISDKHVESNVYLSRLSDSDIDWGFLGAFYNYKHIIPSPASQLSDAQYVQFKQESSTSNKFTMNLLNGNNVNREYWDKVLLSERHVMLTLCNNSHDNQDKNQLATQRTSFWNGNKLGNYDWTLYAKYIIKNGQQFKDKAGTIAQIERNHSYELDFSVMPNYETKQEILVNCIRKQNEINWSEVEK